MSMPKPEVMYDLVYVVGGKVIETVETNKPLAICNWKKNQIKNSTHRSGLLQARKVSDRPKTGW